MGRRSRAEMLNLVDRIVRMYEEDKLSFSQIADRLMEKDGVSISREAVRNAYNKADAKAEKYKLAAQTAKDIIGAAKGTNTELAEAANSLVTSMFYERILQMDGLDFDNDRDFFKAMGPVMKNQTQLATARLTYENGRKKALDEAWDEISRMIGDDPALLDGIRSKFDTLRMKADD